jgi:hypothetical protein
MMRNGDSNLSKTDYPDEINLIRGVATAYMANGNIHRRCMKGTRHKVLEEIERWRLDLLSPQILWLADVAGAGKSTVAKEVADQWKSQKCLAGRFFFSRDAEETRTSKLLFTTIAQQGLAHLNPDVRTAVANGIRNLINPVSATLEEQCSNIFIEPLQLTQSQVVLVLDALDECDPQTCQHLLGVLLSQLSNLPYLKIFVTSRPETHIREALDDVIYREISLRSDETSNSKDVEFFMKQQLERVSLAPNQTTRLIEHAGGLFIWARTVCDLLRTFCGDKTSFVNRIISQDFHEMHSIYRIALEQAIGTDKAKETVEAYMNTLGIIVAVYEPVTPKMIDHFLKISDSMRIIDALGSVLECGGPDAAIRFLHPTFREFLLNASDCKQYSVDMDAAHDLMARACLRIMNEGLVYDICKLYDGEEWRYEPDDLRRMSLRYISSTLQYSCNFWATHVIPQIHTMPPSLAGIIETFFRSKLLDWMYVIGVQGSVDKACTMLRRLISVKSVSNSGSFLHIAN